MNTARYLLIAFILTLGSVSQGKSLYESAKIMMSDLNTGDSALFLHHFEPGVILHHLGDNGLESISLEAFVQVLPKFKNGEYREDVIAIHATELQTGLCYVDIEFSFFINDVLAFSGIDHSLWIQNKEGEYKITDLYTGALKPKFANASGESKLENELNQLLDKWHRDVAEFKPEDYFGLMSDDFIFLGTAPGERWTKSEFETFCKPYFEKKSTWDFKPKERNWYLSHDQQIAWFEESLDTWMQECRGSGVFKKIDGSWKIAHYNLTVLIENEKIQKFIKLRKK